MQGAADNDTKKIEGRTAVKCSFRRGLCTTGGTYKVAPPPGQVEYLFPALDLDAAPDRCAEDEVDHLALFLDFGGHHLAPDVDYFQVPPLVVLVMQRVEGESREIFRLRGRINRVIPLATRDGSRPH